MALSDALNTEWIMKLTDKVSQPLVSIRRHADQAEASIAKVDKKASTLGDGLNSRMGGFSSTLLAGAGGFVAGMATSAIASFNAGALQEAADADKALGQIQQGLISTKGVSGQTVDSLLADSKRLREQSLFGDDEIVMKLQAQLLTFTNITGQNFKRAETAAIDLATRLGGDLQGSAIMLGKALNDPVQGLTALRRVGVSFTEDQQRLIKTLVESNQLFDAQKIILDELQRQYGGSGAAAADSMAGALHRQSEAVKDLQESWGNFLHNSGIVQGATNFFNFFNDMIDPSNKVNLSISNNESRFADMYKRGITPTDSYRQNMTTLDRYAYANYYRDRARKDANATYNNNLATDGLMGATAFGNLGARAPFVGALPGYVAPTTGIAGGKSIEDLQNELKGLQEQYGLAKTDAERKGLIPQISNLQKQIEKLNAPLQSLEKTVKGEMGGINSKVVTEKTPRIITVNINKLVEQLTVNNSGDTPLNMEDVAKGLMDAVRDVETGLSAN